MMITLTLPQPPKELHPNSRANLWARIKAKRTYQREVWVTARQQIGNGEPRIERATLALDFVYPTNRHRDQDGLTAWSKALIDVLASPRHATDETPRLSLIEADDAAHLTITSVTARYERGCQPHVLVTITDTTPRPATAGRAQQGRG